MAIVCSDCMISSILFEYINRKQYFCLTPIYINMKGELLLSLDFGQIQNLLGKMSDNYRIIQKDYGFVRSFIDVKDVAARMLIPGQPYRLVEGRLVYLRKGSIHMRLNLREKMLQAPMLAIISPGTVGEIKDFSQDCDFAMLTFRDSFMESFRRDGLLQTYLRQQLSLCLPLRPEEGKRFEELCALFWEVLHDRPAEEDLIKEMILLMFKQATAWRKKYMSEEKKPLSRQEDILDRFIDLVNEYAIKERKIPFYADKLCLTPHYLSSIIQHTSHQTIMDWINRAVIQEAQLLLLHSDLQITQIADHLNFPNASFFCKYFRRLTGMSPGEYQKRDK